MDRIVPQIERELRAKYSHMLIRWYEAVDWREPLIVGAMLFHTVLLAAVVLARRRLYVQGALFLLIVGLLALAERVNTWAHDNWRSFASQQYFDRHGVFLGIFYAGPLLVIGFVQLVLNLKTMADMVVIVKRAELQQKQRRESKKQQ